MRSTCSSVRANSGRSMRRPSGITMKLSTSMSTCDGMTASPVGRAVNRLRLATDGLLPQVDVVLDRPVVQDVLLGLRGLGLDDVALGDDRLDHLRPRGLVLRDPVPPHVDPG